VRIFVRVKVFTNYIYFRFIIVCDFVEKISNDMVKINAWSLKIE